ncbi:MAG: acetate--CoA ligase family protein [Pseudomonadota bacterium]
MTAMQQLDPDQFARLKACFAPASAAIIGASTNPMKFGGRALKFCLERGYGGRLYPVNARNAVVQGVDAFASVADLPEAPEIAVIAVPAPQVRENLIAAGEKGAQVAIVYGAQFAEAGGRGQERQDELLAICQDHNMRMIGPNCMGVISLASGFVASFTAAPEHHNGNGWPDVGNVSVASQSGAVGIQIFAQLRDRGLGLANWISTGNQADIDVADAIAYYAGDAATKTIAVYMEDASRGLKLCQALELARQARKPVVILKVGTTRSGGDAAASHTASMYSEDRLVDDIFAQYGVLRAGSVNEMIDLVAACSAGVIPKGPDVAAISVSGGGAVMIADAAEKHGLELTPYPADALADLKSTNDFVNDRNPIDISAPSMSNMAITGGHLKWGLERGYSSMIGYISHVPLVPRTREPIMEQLLTFGEDHPDQLIALAANTSAEDRKALIASGITMFDDPVAATEAVGKLVKAGAAHEKPVQQPSAPEEPGDLAGALNGAGITLAIGEPVNDVGVALDLLASEGSIVLKLAAPELKHRTELDGVRLDLRTEDAVRGAYASLSDIVGKAGGAIEDLHITAAPMIAGVEMLIGVRRDPQFGPLIVCGTGGVMCSLFDDLQYAKAPVSQTESLAMIERTKGAAMLKGWRGAPAVGLADLAESLARLSELAPRLPEFEINPVMVSQGALIAVDLVVE